MDQYYITPAYQTQYYMNNSYYSNAYYNSFQQHESLCSSGYESIDSSINNSPQFPATKVSKKRSREESNSTIQSSKVNQLIDQIFDNTNEAQTKQPKAKKQKKDAEQQQLEDLKGDLNEYEYEECSVTGKKKRVLTREQRLKANVRERNRMHIMNDSFVQLRQVLPQTTGRKRRKMSRLDIVMSACEYIVYLDLLLQSDQPQEINFESYLNSIDFNFLN
jgi:hypothetical protein